MSQNKGHLSKREERGIIRVTLVLIWIHGYNMGYNWG